MRRAKLSLCGWMITFAVCVGYSLSFPLQLNAQSCPNGSQAQNGVYNSTCSNGNPGVVGSPAFIDASVFVGSGTNQSSTICGAIYGILSGAFYSYPATTGAVIDARGISGAALTCTSGKTPWNNGTTSLSVPSNILLPAGTIVISTGWVLPPNTHLIGQGDNISAGTTTTIQATSGMSGDMIAYCSSTAPSQNPPASPSCVGIAVENLVLNGNGSSVNGVVNYYAGSLSYVNHVSLYQVLGTGLLIGSEANGSGPYTNIICNCLARRSG